MRVREQRSWWSPALTTAAVLVALATGACGADTPQTETDAEDHAEHEDQGAAASQAGMGVSRVYFVSPRNGDTVTSPVTFRFGAEQFTIAAVPEGEITAEQVRPGVGHYHIGVNADCLPPGEVIPQSEPWVHFGRGNDSIEMELEPGTHKFSVQAGDDLHRTVAGLCETINITVR